MQHTNILQNIVHIKDTLARCDFISYDAARRKKETRAAGKVQFS